jgi:hypothetical protein
MMLTRVSPRGPTAEERHALEQLAHSRIAQARLVGRAQVLRAIAETTWLGVAQMAVAPPDVLITTIAMTCPAEICIGGAEDCRSIKS